MFHYLLLCSGRWHNGCRQKEEGFGECLLAQIKRKSNNNSLALCFTRNSFWVYILEGWYEVQTPPSLLLVVWFGGLDTGMRRLTGYEKIDWSESCVLWPLRSKKYRNTRNVPSFSIVPILHYHIPAPVQETSGAAVFLSLFSCWSWSIHCAPAPTNTQEV